MFQNGKFMPTASNADLKPFRAFFKPSGPTNARVFNFVIDNKTLGIESMASDIEADGHSPIYSISGQMISKDGNRAGLKKGVYIQNNKKFIIR